MEALRLRAKDLELARRQLVVPGGKGDKDRVSMIPSSQVESLERQLDYARVLHRNDLAEGLGAVWLPDALARKYPAAPKEWGWQWVFPAAALSTDPRGASPRLGAGGAGRRHHLADDRLQRALKRALRGAGIAKNGSPPPSATPSPPRLRPSGFVLRLSDRCLATKTWHHPDLHHVLNLGPKAVRSPLDG